MPRPSSIHVCSACGHETPRWEGRCGGCGEWNTLVEEVREAASGPGSRRARAAPAAAATPVALGQVRAAEHARLSTGSGELDTVLGGGIAPGSPALLGGGSGIGKARLTKMGLGN